ncbi:MAG TPA: hypothetical protein ENN87_00995 [Phycisphaerales bacterium]|nr:hypothetical protein [Phycisphaerales bacterium]
MNRTLRVIVGVVLVAVITFAGISVCQNLAPRAKIDITERNLYTLSPGTKAILSRLSQPVTLKLYYTKTAAMKATDQIRFFNNYYYYVKALLEEYAAASDKVRLEVIDPRPYSDEEEEAIRHGLRRFSITEEENFFFGLVVQTPFGVTKTIEFFSPDRQNFVEYDISYLVETATTRDKRRLGVLSSLPVMGDNPWMARMQQAQSQPKWTVISHLEQRYDVRTIEADVDQIENVDILLVIHPKDLPEKTLFAIDQYILKGGRAIILVDPWCRLDQPNPMQRQMMPMQDPSSSLEKLLNTWGLTMPANTFAGDRALARPWSGSPTQRPQPLIGFLDLNQPTCFSDETAITADLNIVTILFGGVLREIPLPDLKSPSEKSQGGAEQDALAPNVQRTPLVTTTASGNAWAVSGPFELMYPQPAELMKKFTDGTEPVAMGYLVTGRLPSAFPDGIEVEVEVEAESETPDPNDTADTPKTRRVTGLTVAEEDCAVAVFSDVDFITDGIAYRDAFFGMMIVGDNSALLLNCVEDLSGSGDLISIRSRGNYRRPFTTVDEIEQQAEAETREEEQKLQAQIETWQEQLNEKLSGMKADEASLIGQTILQEKRQLETRIYEANRRLREVRMKRRERIEALGRQLRNFCTIPGPVIILLVAVVLGVRRQVLKRRYISHASDA